MEKLSDHDHGPALNSSLLWTEKKKKTSVAYWLPG